MSKHVQPKSERELRVNFLALEMRAELNSMIEAKGQPRKASDKLKAVCLKNLDTLVGIASRLS